jgi:glucokinase
MKAREYRKPGVHDSVRSLRSSQSSAVIGIDLGGTKIASGLFTSHGKLRFKNVLRLDGQKGSAVAALIRNEIARLQSLARAQKIKIKAVGISVPGIACEQTGRVWAPNIPGWENYPLQREIKTFLDDNGIHVLIDSDRACSILGEVWQGAAKGCQHAIFMAVGTGIGAGIIIDGKVLRGAGDIAGAIGWMALDRLFRREYKSCGCFEHHASGEGLVKAAHELMARKEFKGLKIQDWNQTTAREIFSACDRNDQLAKAVVKEAIQFWGMAVANLVSLFNPEKIIFGGGVFGPARKFLPDIHAEAKKWAQPIAMQRVKLQASQLGSDAALYGAGYITRNAVLA